MAKPYGNDYLEKMSSRQCGKRGRTFEGQRSTFYSWGTSCYESAIHWGNSMVLGTVGKILYRRNGDWEASNKMSVGDYGQVSLDNAFHWVYELFFGIAIVDGHVSRRVSWCVHSGYIERTHNGRMTVARWQKAPIYHGNELGQLAGTRSTLKVD